MSTNINDNKFKIKKINIIGCWTYNLKCNKDCTICTYSLNQDSLFNQDKCVESQISEGLCGHTFHSECIKPWITNYKHCPICSKTWKCKI
jgi:RING-box protein 1